jgi:hypothetical protein
MRCAAIKRAGERCKLDATSGSFCWSHAPENAAARKSKARRGGKARGAGELGELKRRLRALCEEVIAGRVNRADAAVAGQLLGTYIRAVSVETKLREVDELEGRISELEETLAARARRMG